MVGSASPSQRFGGINQDNFVKLFRELIFLTNSEHVMTGQDVLDHLMANDVHKNNPYHDETLIEHLCETAAACHTRAIHMGYIVKKQEKEEEEEEEEEKEEVGGYQLAPSVQEFFTSPWVFYLSGFLHDIGKPGSYRQAGVSNIGKKKKMYTNGHGLIGCAILESWLMSNEFRESFGLSEKDCEALAVATNYHMYVYPLTRYGKLDKVRIAIVANALTIGSCLLLNVLRYGDAKGKSPLVSTPAHPSRPIFLNDEAFGELQEEYEATLLEYTKNPPNLFKMMENAGLVICLTGYSGTGKTTRRNQLVSYLETQFNLKLGDDIHYINCPYEIHATLGKYDLKQRRLFYDQMKADITSAANAGRIVLIDTMAGMSNISKEYLYENVPSNTIKVDLICTRFPDTSTDEETRTRHYITVKQQRAVNKEQDKASPMNRNSMDPVGPRVPLFLLNSVCERKRCTYLRYNNSQEKELKNPWARNTINRHHAHYVLPVAHGKDLMFSNFSRVLLTNLMNSRQAYVTNDKSWLPPLTYNLAQEDETNLQALLQKLLNQCPHPRTPEQSLRHTRRFFEESNYIFSLTEIAGTRKIVSINYIDKKNRLFAPLWAREARGAAFIIYVPEFSDKWTCLLYKAPLLRCFEILSSYHKSNDVKASQHMAHVRDISFIDKAERRVVERFNHNPSAFFGQCPGDGDDVWELSEKVDGSLCNVSVFSSQHPAYVILTDSLRNGKLDLWHCFVADFLIIPSTKNSIQISDNMKSTFITAFWSSLFPKLALPKPTEKCDEIWESTLKQAFGEAVSRIASTNIEEGQLTLLFEIVCAKRTTFDGTCHKDLAVAYDHGGAYLFGGIANGKWINAFPTQTSFPTPARFIIKKPADATSKLASLLDSTSPHKEGYILNRLTRDVSSLVTSCKLKHPLYYKARGKTNRALLFTDDCEAVVKSDSSFNRICAFYPTSATKLVQMLPLVTPHFLNHLFNKIEQTKEKLKERVPKSVASNPNSFVYVKFCLHELFIEIELANIVRDSFQPLFGVINASEEEIVTSVQDLFKMNCKDENIALRTVVIPKSFCDIFSS